MHRISNKVICTVTLAVWLELVLWSAYSVFVLHQTDLYAENGVLENIQVILLAGACMVFLASVVLGQRSDKLILSSCTLLCYTFLLRELEVQDFDVHSALIFMGSGAGRNATIGLAFASLGVYAVFHFSYYMHMVLGFLSSMPALFLLTGGVLLLVGRFIEVQDAIIHNVYFEELAELSAYFLILLAAFAVTSSKGQNESI